MFDYLRNFPIAAELLPHRLRDLLSPIGMGSDYPVEVCSTFEHDRDNAAYECLHMLMALVEDADEQHLPALHSEEGVVAFSVPDIREKGAVRNFSPNIDGHDYIVAAWGDGSFYAYNLAEKVWMALGLVPRCIGNDIQKLVYDDLQVPTTHIAEGEISGRYFWEPSRDIRWTMSNEYLRKYLWMRGAQGARVFFYEATVQDRPELRALMGADNRFDFEEEGHWCSVSLLEIDRRIRLQVWATVVVVSCERLPEQIAYGLRWPGITEPVTRAFVDQLDDRTFVFLNDKFLEQYEQDAFYDSIPVKVFGTYWVNSPSYHGKWAFTDCKRVGRNIIRVRLRDLYRGIPARETLHAHSYAMDPDVVAQLDDAEEHIVAKTERLAKELLDLADNLCELGAAIGIELEPVSLIKLSRASIEANGWTTAPALVQLARVAPLEMSQQAFLSRCKALHEIWQVIPEGVLKRLLIASGIDRKELADYRSLRLLQALLNVLESLDGHQEDASAFASENAPENWARRNERLAALFVLRDLRTADAHTLTTEGIQRLEELGFDRATLHPGYGGALDFIFNGVINSFAAVNQMLKSVLNR
ncbi:hypothetical protein [Paraburkholderia sp.]|uniref:hypothetical protein n=1 Tax=Paraburkholderia sp. TaxID=1926495 RepID=UPI003D6ED26E